MLVRKQQRGFSLIELLIVVAVLGVIAAIAIPSIIASKRAANEGSARGSMRTIHSAQVTYQATAGQGEFGTLAELQTETLIDTVLGSGFKSGYTFACLDANLNAGPPANYFATAIPTDTNFGRRTGNNSFAIADDGVLRGKLGDTPAADHNEVISGAWPPVDY